MSFLTFVMNVKGTDRFGLGAFVFKLLKDSIDSDLVDCPT